MESHETWKSATFSIDRHGNKCTYLTRIKCFVGQGTFILILNHQTPKGTRLPTKSSNKRHAAPTPMVDLEYSSRYAACSESHAYALSSLRENI